MDYFLKSIIPILIFAVVLYGMIKKVKVYECFVEGAKDGLQICFRIFPYILAMLLAVSILREGGVLTFFNNIIAPFVKLIGLPPEVVPLVLIKPLSGSGSLGVYAELLKNYGADSYIGILASIIMGSTETIFYTLTVYFGAVNIKRIRHTLYAAIMADLTAIILAVIITRFLILKH
ncbi:MAG: spore maturation protein [Clostridiaceae bacterium]